MTIAPIRPKAVAAALVEDLGARVESAFVTFNGEIGVFETRIHKPVSRLVTNWTPEVGG